jgi:oligoendopeptidase F
VGNHNRMSEKESKSQKLPTRDQVPVEDTWDLSVVYADNEAWEQEYEQIKSQISQFEAFRGTLSQSADSLLNCLKLRDAVYEKISKLHVYARMRKDEDTGRAAYQALEDRATTLVHRLRGAASFIVPEILAIPESQLQEFLQNDQLQLYRHDLHKITRRRDHVLSAAEEAIIAQTGDLTGGPSNIFGMLNNADLTFKPIINQNGEEIDVTHGRYGNLMESKDRRVRKDTFQSMYASYTKYKNTFAATLNASIKKDVFLGKVRKYDSALEAALDEDNVPVSVYESLISTVHDHLPLIHRYFALRKKILGLDECHMYDLSVSLVDNQEMDIPFEEAKKIVLDGLQPLGKEYLDIAAKGFDSRWIDVYENVGKRSGAYSSGTYGTPPYMLLNYTNNLKNVFTLAHELGHSMHTYYTHQEQPYVYSKYTIFVAEVASTLNENLLIDHLLEKTTDPKKKLYILNQYIERFKSTLFRQTMFAEFEKITHETVEKGEALTPDSLCQVYGDLNAKYHGPDVAQDPEITMEWARIPHFYYRFYVYKYSTGFSAAAALAKKIQEEGQPAVDRYLQFLKAGDSAYSIDLLKIAGVDMTTPEPVRDALQVFERLLDEMERLVGELDKK